MNEIYKTNVKERSVWWYVSEGRIGSVLRWGNGRKSTIPDNIQTALDLAVTVSGHFVAMGGKHLNCDNGFIATERRRHVTMVKDLETKKKECEEAKKREDNAKAIIDKYRSMDKDIKNPTHAKELTVTELKT